MDSREERNIILTGDHSEPYSITVISDFIMFFSLKNLFHECCIQIFHFFACILMKGEIFLETELGR